MNKEKRTEFLKEQLERTNYWLSFAEAKNAALIAINIAIAAVMINVIDNHPTVTAITIIVLTISSTVCIWSFKPNGSTANHQENTTEISEPDLKKNLLFWGDIAQIFSSDKYRQLLCKQYFECAESESLSKLEQDFIDEIYINSLIAKNKYDIFKKALYIDLVSCLMCIIVFIVVA